MIELSLVIACYNEEKILEESVEKIESVLKYSNITYEVIFVDDCSKDKTREIIRKLVKKKKNFTSIFHETNQGRGKTVTDGFLLVKSKVVGYIDIDLEAAPVYIPYFTGRILDGKADVVTGLRVYRENFYSFHRAILSRGYSWLVRKILGIPLRDTETGYKFFDRKKILSVLQQVKNPGWFWDTEIMTYAYRKKLRIEEIPVLFIRRFDKKSSVNLVKDTYEYLVNLLRFRHVLSQSQK